MHRCHAIPYCTIQRFQLRTHVKDCPARPNKSTICRQLVMHDQIFEEDAPAVQIYRGVVAVFAPPGSLYLVDLDGDGKGCVVLHVEGLLGCTGRV